MTAQEIMVDVSTTLGDFRVKLYDDTPLHRDNFIKLVKDGAYDGVLFHRVIKDFMVQTGDPNSKDSTSTMPLGKFDRRPNPRRDTLSGALPQVWRTGCRTHQQSPEALFWLAVLYCDRTQV